MFRVFGKRRRKQSFYAKIFVKDVITEARSFIRLFLMAGLPVVSVCGQVEAPTFEVAAIKPNHSGCGNSSTTLSKGRLTIINQSLRQLIERAYDVRDFSFSGPGWLDTQCFDVVAKPPEGTMPKQFLPMLQTLLTERFKLAVHRESKMMSGYALMLAKPDILKLEPADRKNLSSTSTGRGMIKARATSMTYFADMLARQLNQPVQDLTGLTGPYNFKLQWTPDASPAETGADLQSEVSIFTALQEQLGLRLRAQKIAVEVLVVDHAEKTPTEN